MFLFSKHFLGYNSASSVFNGTEHHCVNINYIFNIISIEKLRWVQRRNGSVVTEHCVQRTRIQLFLFNCQISEAIISNSPASNFMLSNAISLMRTSLIFPIQVILSTCCVLF